MATEITVEVDDIHELMFKELMEDADEEPELEEWAQDTVTSMIYNAYQQQ